MSLNNGEFNIPIQDLARVIPVDREHCVKIFSAALNGMMNDPHVCSKLLCGVM